MRHCPFVVKFNYSPPGADSNDQADVPGQLLAKVPDPLPAGPAEPCAQSRAGLTGVDYIDGQGA
jgi:hypothetical protein